MPSDPSRPSLVQRHASPSLPRVGAMLLLAIMWGLSIPVTKLGLVTMPPLPLTALRFAVAVPLLFLFVVGRQRLPWRAFPPVAALGILGIGVGQVTQTLGVVGTSASVGTIISATIPVFVVVFAALRLQQAVSGRQALGLLAALHCAGRVGTWPRGAYRVRNHRGRCESHAAFCARCGFLLRLERRTHAHVWHRHSGGLEHIVRVRGVVAVGRLGDEADSVPRHR
jgi:uncharacterized membrane protein